MSKGKENKDAGAASVSILKYLEQQNRPYSAVDILNNLHNQFGKAIVMKSLEVLAEAGQIKEKPYGKQKVYVFNQENVPSADAVELKAMDDEIQSLQAQLEKLQAEHTSLSTDHKRITAHMTLEEAKQKLSEVSKECETCQVKLNKLSNGQVLISKEEKQKVYSKKDVKIKEWRKRKRIACDIIDAVLEGYPKPKKSLLEEVGIETDEDCNVVLPK